MAGFDAFCVLLERDGEQQIVYKHSITTTVPAYPVDLREDGDAPAPPPPVEKVSQAPADRRTQGPPPVALELGPQAGVNFGTDTSAATSSNTTFTGISHATASGLTPTMLLSSRGPSSSSTIATT